MNFEQARNLIGRILISAIFIYAIPDKIMNFEKTIAIITSKNINNNIAYFLLLSAIICLIIGSILFISGFKQSLGASLLLIFIIPTTFIFHFYPLQIRAVLMNAGLIGGLILGLQKANNKSLKDIFNNQTTRK
tara:strand:- start:1463 stop:1861 length:399 start_codon:yes stop_codon:yes gene_type:complete